MTVDGRDGADTSRARGAEGAPGFKLVDIEEVSRESVRDRVPLRRPFVVRNWIPSAQLESGSWGAAGVPVTVVPPGQSVVTSAAYASGGKKLVVMPLSELLERLEGVGGRPPIEAEGERYYLFGGGAPPELAAQVPWPQGFEHIIQRLYVTSPGVVSKCHFDRWTVFLMQMRGRKNVRLFAPSDYPFLYPVNNTETGEERRCLIDLSAPDYEKYPLFRRATCFETTLGPGDLLYLPPRWWHEMRTLDVSFTIQSQIRRSAIWDLREAADILRVMAAASLVYRTSSFRPDIVFGLHRRARAPRAARAPRGPGRG